MVLRYPQGEVRATGLNSRQAVCLARNKAESCSSFKQRNVKLRYRLLYITSYVEYSNALNNIDLFYCLICAVCSHKLVRAGLDILSSYYSLQSFGLIAQSIFSSHHFSHLLFPSLLSSFVLITLSHYFSRTFLLRALVTHSFMAK